MPRKVVRKERGVFEKMPGSDIWWIRFKVAGVEQWEKVGRRGDAIKLNAWAVVVWGQRDTTPLRTLELCALYLDLALYLVVLYRWLVPWTFVGQLVRLDSFCCGGLTTRTEPDSQICRFAFFGIGPKPEPMLLTPSGNKNRVTIASPHSAEKVFGALCLSAALALESAF
jgi:hypothetical protein